MNKIQAWLARCPTITTGTVTAAVTAIIALLVAFGARFTRDQTDAILGVVAVLGPLVVGGVAKIQTVPSTAVVAHQDPDDGHVIAGQAAPEPTGTEIEVTTTPAVTPHHAEDTAMQPETEDMTGPADDEQPEDDQEPDVDPDTELEGDDTEDDPDENLDDDAVITTDDDNKGEG